MIVPLIKHKKKGQVPEKFTELGGGAYGGTGESEALDLLFTM
jgi:hypothetical protein